MSYLDNLKTHVKSVHKVETSIEPILLNEADLLWACIPGENRAIQILIPI